MFLEKRKDQKKGAQCYGGQSAFGFLPALVQAVAKKNVLRAPGTPEQVSEPLSVLDGQA